MSGIRTLRTGSLVAMATLSCAVVAVAGCGSTDAASGTVTDADSPAASGPNSALQFAKCMRANGVTNFPDPTGGSGAVQIQGTGLNPQSPAFQAAQRACQKYLPTQGQPQVMSDANRKKAVAFAECMRTHGEPDFPDPLLSAPSPSALVFSLRGMLFAPGPGLNPGSPAFRQAATGCGVKLPQPGAKSTAP